MESAVADTRFADLREGVRALCAQFDSAYWQKVDEARAYPEAFVDALTQAGWMAALIPEQYGGSGLSLTEATVIMEEVSRSGGNPGLRHRPGGGAPTRTAAAPNQRERAPPVDTVSPVNPLAANWLGKRSDA